MFKPVALAILFILTLNSISSSNTKITEEYDNNVLILNDDNYDALTKKYPLLLVEYYAPWCGHCQKLAPEYEKAATELKSSKAKLAKLDCTANRNVSKKLGIRGYPTLILYDHGAQTEYESKRKAEDIVSFIKDKIKHSSVELKTTADLDKLETSLSGIDIAIVFFGDYSLNRYLEFTKEITGVNFYHCISNECCKHFRVKNGAVTLLRKFGPSHRVSISPDFNLHRLKTLIYNEGAPETVSLNEENLEKILKGKEPALVFFHSESNKDRMTYIAGRVKNMLGKTSLLTITSGFNNSSADRKLVEMFNLKKKSVPFVAILSYKSFYKVYQFKGDLNAESIINFVTAWDNNEIQYEIKSERVLPAEYNKGPIFKLVAYSFEDFIKDKNKNSLILFTNSNCMVCDMLRSMIKDVIKELKGNDQLKFGEIDLSLNDIGFSIPILPSIQFMNKETKFLIPFTGDRKVGDLLKFVNERLAEMKNSEKEVKKEATVVKDEKRKQAKPRLSPEDKIEYIKEDL